MRSTVLVPGLVAGLLLVGCGAGQPPGQTTTSTARSAPTTTAPSAAIQEEELDVDADADPDDGAPPLKVQFTASVEEDEKGGPFSFKWNFGDGATSTEQNPVHVYEKGGEYTATLTVTDQKGDAGTDEVDISVQTQEEGGEG